MTTATVTAPPLDLSGVADLHSAKDRIYNDSWCRRGELVSIWPNIFRKADRLSIAADDLDKACEDAETLSDTATDLMVYLFKYSVWLADGKTLTPSHLETVNRELVESGSWPYEEPSDIVGVIRGLTEGLEVCCTQLSSGSLAGDRLSAEVDRLRRVSWVVANYFAE